MNKHYIREEDYADEEPLNREEIVAKLWHRIVIVAVLCIVGMLVFSGAKAQTVNGSASVSWVLPTMTDGPVPVPLTGAAALTELRLYVAKQPIISMAGLEAIVIGPGLTTFQYGAPVQNGETLYFRLAACNRDSNGTTQCGQLSNEASKQILVDTTPGVPTNVTVEISITP